MRDGLRALAWIICSALLVLLVPSSAWSVDTASPRLSLSSSLLAGSCTDSTEPPSPSTSPTTDPSSDPSEDPCPTEPTPEPTPTEPTPEPTPTEPTPEPTPTEPTPEPTPTEPTPEPTPTEPTPEPLCTSESPCVVEPSANMVALVLLLGGVSVTCLLGLLVRSFVGRG